VEKEIGGSLVEGEKAEKLDGKTKTKTNKKKVQTCKCL
jgi:hypothetical protein